MKCKFFLVLLFWGILCCGAQKNNNYDYLELALKWPNSYCLTHDGECREIVPQHFTISMLQPKKRGGPKLEYCPTPCKLENSTIEKYKDDLIKFWPDLSNDNFQVSKPMWMEQWLRYGSCSDAIMKPEDYILCVLNRRKDHDLKQILRNAGIVPNANQYPPRRILRAFRKALGVNVDIVCETDTSGNLYLSEIHQCFDYYGTTLIDCYNLAKGCDDDPIFPYMGYEPDNDPK